MQDIFKDVNHWKKENKDFAIATVIKTWGSAPRPVGSGLAISEELEMSGSVSGGCVEGAVAKAAKEIMANGQPQLLKFGVTDEDAWAVGLSCGGAIQVWTEPAVLAGPQIEHIESAVAKNEACVWIRRLDTAQPDTYLWFPEREKQQDDIPSTILAEAQRAFAERKTQTTDIEGKPYFIQVFPRKSQLLVVGAAHITADLVHLGNLYDFETVVIDPRGIFANKTQFPSPPHQLHVDWPAEVLTGFKLDQYAYAVLLTHDPKIDDQALHLLLKSDIAYIGALGSRRTHAKRVKRLTEAGFSEAQIDRIHGPVGININAKRPKEIALSIMAQIIETKNAFL